MLSGLLAPLVVVLVLGIILGVILGIAEKVLTVEMDPRLAKLIELLPGYNCGACGSPGCEGHANAVMGYESKLKQCKPMKAEQEKVILEFLAASEGPNGEKIDMSKI